MRSARKLRGTNIYINDDLCTASQAIKNAQMPQLKQARAQGKVAFFRYTRLIVRDSTTRGESQPGRSQGGTGVAAVDGGSRAPAAAAATAAGVVAGGGADISGDFPPLSRDAPRRSDRRNKK